MSKRMSTDVSGLTPSKERSSKEISGAEADDLERSSKDYRRTSTGTRRRGSVEPQTTHVQRRSKQGPGTLEGGLSPGIDKPGSQEGARGRLPSTPTTQPIQDSGSAEQRP